MNFLMFLKPILPSNLGLQSLSQFTRWILCLLSSPPHQNFLIMISSSLQREVGSRKQLITYMGIVCATAFIRISLPAYDSSFSPHPCITRHALSFMLLKEACLFLPTKEGMPRYFSNSFISGMLRLAYMAFFVSSSTFLLKQIVVLSWFNFCPDSTSYFYRIC